MNASSCCALGSFVNLERTILRSSLIAAALLALTINGADAGFMLNFNSLAANVNSATGTDSIETYIEGVIGSNVTVEPGTKTLKEKPENVGPTNYLGNTDNGVWHANPKDTYLINRWNYTSLPSNVRDRIKITFDVALASIEFDWQIFPVTTGKADFTVKADGIQYLYYDNSSNKTSGYLSHSKIVFTTPVNTIEFIDWTTAPVGIDNLYIDYPPPPQTAVPEPATGLMALLGGLGIVAVRRRRDAA